MPILMLLPALFTMIGSIAGPMLESHKSSIVTKILGGDFNGTPGSLMNIILSTITNLNDAQKAEINAQLNTLLASQEVNKIDAVSDSKFQRFWRPEFAWAISIIIQIHLAIAELFNILHSVGYHVGLMAPMDTMTVLFMSGLLGIYMTARTVEKVNNNQS